MKSASRITRNDFPHHSLFSWLHTPFLSSSDKLPRPKEATNAINVPKSAKKRKALLTKRRGKYNIKDIGVALGKYSTKGGFGRDAYTKQYHSIDVTVGRVGHHTLWDALSVHPKDALNQIKI
jgi:hypothetical protein